MVKDKSLRGRARDLALWLTIVAAVVNLTFAISINDARISDLAGKTASMQDTSQRIASSPNASNVGDLTALLKIYAAQRDSLIGQINYGMNTYWDTNFVSCIKGTIAPCFHRNSSDANNIIIAFMAGMIGSGIVILRGAKAAPWGSAGSEAAEKSRERGFQRLLLGGIVGLLSLFFIRGTKGALLSSVSGMVQVDNPYGTAFVAVIAVMFLDRFLDFLDRWMASLRVGGMAGPQTVTVQEHVLPPPAIKPAEAASETPPAAQESGQAKGPNLAVVGGTSPGSPAE